MTALGAALAWVGTLAFVGWVLWLKDRRAETVAERLAATDKRLADLEATAKARDELLAVHANAIQAARSIADNLQLRLGLGKKSEAPRG